MKLKLLFFASHKRAAGLSETSLELNEGVTVREAAHLVELKYNLSLTGSMVAVNDEYATPDDILQPWRSFLRWLAANQTQTFFWSRATNYR
jgi:MoaE-MoaD fusion protein